MNNTIWKMPDQKPEPYKILVIKTDKGNFYTETRLNEKYWNPIILPEFYSIDDIDKAERITQYAYLDDLIAQADKAERLQKAVDLALGWLEKVATPAKCDDDLCREFTKRKIDEIKQLIKEG